MKYCITYYDGCRHINDVDEIIIPYTHKTTELIRFIQEHEHQRIIADCTKFDGDLEKSFTDFSVAKKLNENFTIIINYNMAELCPILQENGIKYFFEEIIYDSDTFKDMLEAGVSDMRVGGSLCFSADKLHNMCQEKSIALRVRPNIIEYPRNPFASPDLTNFFIRPEDIEEYNQFFDVCEFAYSELDKQAVLFDIYKDGKWLGDLKDLIINLPYSVNSLSLVPHFGMMRRTCDRRCVYGRCGICNASLALSQALDEKGFGLKKKN